MEQLEVDDDVYAVLSVRAEEKGFDSTEEYIKDVLNQIVEKVDPDASEKDEAVKRKLKDLGYMD